MTSNGLTPIEWAAVAVLAAWTMTLVFMLRYPSHSLRSSPAARLLLPTWRLFAPETCDSDVEVVCRGWSEGAGFTDWSHSAAIGERGRRTALFHECIKAEKMVRDLAGGLINAEIRGEDGRSTKCYAALMRCAAARLAPNVAEAVEFAIVESFGYLTDKEPLVVYFSGLQSRREIF